MQSMLLVGNFGLTEILLIFGVIVLLFGSSQIPKLAKSIGESIKEFKKAKDETLSGDGEGENKRKVVEKK